MLKRIRSSHRTRGSERGLLGAAPDMESSLLPVVSPPEAEREAEKRGENPSSARPALRSTGAVPVGGSLIKRLVKSTDCGPEDQVVSYTNLALHFGWNGSV